MMGCFDGAGNVSKMFVWLLKIIGEPACMDQKKSVRSHREKFWETYRSFSSVVSDARMRKRPLD